MSDENKVDALTSDFERINLVKKKWKSKTIDYNSPSGSISHSRGKNSLLGYW